MKQYKWTLVGLILAILIIIFSNLFELDPFDRLVELFASVEEYEFDEIFIAAIVFLVFFAVDLFIRQRDQRVEMEKVKIYRAMISSSHHILNNFLNQMLLFKMEAESSPSFDRSILTLFDQVINDATEQINALSSLNNVSEEAIKEVVKPKA